MSYFQTIFIHEGDTDKLYIRKLIDKLCPELKENGNKLTFARHFILNEKNLNKLKSERSSKSSTKKNTSNICYILEEVKKLILLKS